MKLCLTFTQAFPYFFQFDVSAYLLDIDFVRSKLDYIKDFNNRKCSTETCSECEPIDKMKFWIKIFEFRTLKNEIYRWNNAHITKATEKEYSEMALKKIPLVTIEGIHVNFSIFGVLMYQELVINQNFKPKNGKIEVKN